MTPPHKPVAHWREVLSVSALALATVVSLFCALVTAITLYDLATAPRGHDAGLVPAFASVIDTAGAVLLLVLAVPIRTWRRRLQALAVAGLLLASAAALSELSARKRDGWGGQGAARPASPARPAPATPPSTPPPHGTSGKW